MLFGTKLRVNCFKPETVDINDNKIIENASNVNMKIVNFFSETVL